MRKSVVFMGAVCLAVGLGLTGTAMGISVTPETDAMTLAAAVTGGGGSGLVVTGATLSGHTTGGGGVSSGTYTNASGTYAPLGPGIVLSTGSVQDYGDGPNTSTGFSTFYSVPATPAQEALLDPITGGLFDHFDVTQLDITFDMLAGSDTAFFNVVFGSEEFPEFVGDVFIDGFGLFVNGVNIAFLGGLPINIDHPAFSAVLGTELDGILRVGTVSSFVGDGSTGNTLTIIIVDTSDEIWDSTAYISQLGGEAPEPPDDRVVPEPLTLLCLIGGLGGLTRYVRRRSMA